MAVEPVSITLSALALLDPAIRSCRQAYKMYRLGKAFGRDFDSMQRKIDGEKARLEGSLMLELSTAPDMASIEIVKRELGNMRDKFEACQNLIESIDGHVGSSITSDSDVIRRKEGFLAPPSKKSRFKSFFGRKNSPMGRTLTPDSSSSTHMSGITMASSESTPNSSLATTDSSGPTEVNIETERQKSKSREYQKATSLVQKAKWAIGQRKAFIDNVASIHDSNDLIRDIATQRALIGMHRVILGNKSSNELPQSISLVNEALRRAHKGLTFFNKGVQNHPALSASLRILKADEYVSNSKRIALQHPYLNFGRESAIFPLQIDSSISSGSRLVLVETSIKPGERPGVTQDHLNERATLAQTLCDEAADDEEPIRRLGNIVSPDAISDAHVLYQDVSVSWTVHETLQGLISSHDRFRSYTLLAARLATSYMYYVFVGGMRSFPVLSDYHYYTPVGENLSHFNADNILLPYLTAGFGSKAPKRSTLDIGGITSPSMQQDEALTRLGLLLYQVGCWTVLTGDDLPGMRRAVREERNNLLDRTGVSFTGIVDRCLTSMEEDCDPHKEVERLYREVVAPLQELADQIKWDL